MAAWQHLELIEHQTAIAGRAIDAVTKLPITGVKVTITGMPAFFQRWLSLRALPYGDGWESLAQRPDRITTKEDGLFHFMDLPDGVYTLSLSAPSAGPRYGTAQQDFTVTRDGNGDIALSIPSIELTPTGASGKILGYIAPGDPNTAPLAMALVRVVGSGEQTYSGPNGGYALLGVDPGIRHLSITAPGYQPETTTTTIVKGQITLVTDIILDPTP